jgi:hypothetical protein
MGYEIVGIFLQGSQNYELEYEYSDIDCKAIVLPTINDVVTNQKMTSFTHVLPNEEHVDIKDARLMFQSILKQNVNFVEILFTKYMILNPIYEDIFSELLKARERIARYNNYKTISCIAGMASEKYKAMEHPYPSLIAQIEKYGYDPKQLHHIFRLEEFMDRWVSGALYKDCLISKQTKYLILVKSGLHSLETARILADRSQKKLFKLRNKYKSENELIIDDSMYELTMDTSTKLIKTFWKRELVQ